MDGGRRAAAVTTTTHRMVVEDLLAMQDLLTQFGENPPDHARPLVEQAKSGVGSISSIADLVDGSKVAHLADTLADASLQEFAKLQRAEILSKLKALNIGLADRQSFANLIGKASREGSLAPAAKELSASIIAAGGPAASRVKCPVPPNMDVVTVSVSKRVRIFIISDVHTDHAANMEWLKARLPPRTATGFDVLLCPGDVSDKPEVRAAMFEVATSHFDEVVFTVGNHDCWVPLHSRRRTDMRTKQIVEPTDMSAITSMDAFRGVLQQCKEWGVRTEPLWLHMADASQQDVLLVPLQSWYHASWDREPDLDAPGDGSLSRQDFGFGWSDFHNCRWPEPLSDCGKSEALAEHFAKLNETSLAAITSALPARHGRPQPSRRLNKPETYALFGEVPRGSSHTLWPSVESSTFFTPRKVDAFEEAQSQDAAKEAAKEASIDPPGPLPPFVVSLSHFVPRQELLPEKRMLFHEMLHKVSGSDPLERQVRRLLPDMHIFGHTHLNVDRTLEGVRYVQWPLGTPREQKGQTRASSLGMLCVYDAAAGGEQPQFWTHWGRHYEEFERDLTKTALPPYLLQARSHLGGTVASKATLGSLPVRGSDGNLARLQGQRDSGAGMGSLGARTQSLDRLSERTMPSLS